MDIAPLRGLRFDPATLGASGARGEDVTAPPYDVISPAEHQALLERSAYNVARLTLGSEPGAVSDYQERVDLLSAWQSSGVLARDSEPVFYAYCIDYTVPGTDTSAHFVGLVALGRLHSFEDGVVLPHEQTFPKVVEERYQLLTATRTHLESIFLLYADREGTIDAILESAAKRDALLRVEAKPGEFHSLYAVTDPAEHDALRAQFGGQRPIIADGHHRYTMGLRHKKESGAGVDGADWQLMTFANLYGDGLSILATHRLVKLEGGVLGAVMGTLAEKLDAGSEAQWDLCVETAEGLSYFVFPPSLRDARQGAARTDYALLHEVVLGDWLAGAVGEVSYFKEGTGESEALRDGRGDLLFRMRPVDRGEFQRVVEQGEVFPHKTTYFYPKLWSGLVLWPLERP